MLTQLNLIAVILLILATAMLSGLFFVFSNFVMDALSRIRVESGVSAMQSIKSVILNPWFLGLFIGTALGCLGTLGSAATQWSHPASIWMIAGALLYLIGCFLVTAAFNVPLNDQLDAVDAAAPSAGEAWIHYVSNWQPWNHVRTVTTLLSAGCYLVAALKLNGN